MTDYSKCPNCGTPFENVDDYYEEPEMFCGFWRTWHYTCAKCGKKYKYTRDYQCTGEEISEE